MTWHWNYDGWIVLVGVLSACSCALPGTYLVLRRMSLMGDAISHAVLPGLAIAFLISHSRSGLSMWIGAVIVGVLTAVLTQAIVRYGKVESGAAMGVVFSVLFAVGLVLIRQAADHVDLDPGCVLYGNIVLVPLEAIGGDVPLVVWNLAAVLAVNIIFVLLLYKELKVSSFDPELSTTVGINANLMHYLLMIVVAVTTVANFEAVGSILVIGMLIVPATAAHLMTDRLIVMLLLGQVVAAVSAVLGHVLAMYGPGWFGVENAANTSGMIVVTAGGILLLAVVLSPRYGLLGRAWARWSLSMQIVREDILGMLYRRQEAAGIEGAALACDQVVAGTGNTWRSRRALGNLLRGGLVVRSAGGSADAEQVRLSETGRTEAIRLIRSHRLWESYLDQHFDLPRDHLHGSAERMEHFITKEMKQRIGSELTDPAHDPHGKEIPASTRGDGGEG